MWYYLIPLLTIIYAGMVFVSGPVYVRATQDSVNHDTFIGYSVAALAWPVCLPACLLFCAGRWLFTGKYATFLEDYYKKTH